MSVYEPLVRVAATALSPVGDALSDASAFQRLLAQLGMEAPVSDAALAQFRNGLTFVHALEQLPGLIASLDTRADRAEAIVELAQITAEAVQGIANLAVIDASAFASAGPLAQPEFWEDFASALPDLLLARLFADQAPALLAVLRLGGVCVSQRVGSARRDRFRWNLLGPMLADPAAAVRNATRWGGEFRDWWLQRHIGLALARFGLPVRVRERRPAVELALTGVPTGAPTGFESSVLLLEGTTAAGLRVEMGFVFACSRNGGGAVYVGNHASGKLTDAVQIGDDWWLETAGEIDGTATLGVRIQPSGTTLVGGDAALGASIAFIGRPRAPWLLLGSSDGTRIEISGARVELGISGTTDAPEAYALIRVDEGGFRFVLDLGPADTFLRGVIGGAPAMAAGGELRWSSRSGIVFGGGPGLAMTVPLDLQAGPLHVSSLSLELIGSTTAARIRATATGGLTLGPLTGTVENVGAELSMIAAAGGGDLGGFRALLEFVPPSGLGIGVDAEGIITGGGFLSIDDGRYAGVAALQMFGVGLSVVGIIETELPEDPNGWSLFLSVIADFTPVPLGFGFFLSGVGGFMGLHRSLDEVALAEGVREGRIDSLLFPEDPLADATRILADIEAYFPTQQGTHAFGAMARIDWGVPALISGELGVVLVVPDFRVAVVGEIESILPNRDVRLIELRMGVVGYIDPAEATFWVTASIYDSRLIQYALSGDMAMYVCLGDAPYFLLSIGGYHPHWAPPRSVPSSMRGLRRMTAAIDLGEDLQVGLDAYFAVTSNTLQFGAEVFAVAKAHELGVDFSVDGRFSFDVLVIVTPFSIVAGMKSTVSVKVEGETLFSASVKLHLEGPQPWYGRATASFEYCGVPIDFHVAVGGTIADDRPDGIELWVELERALRDPGNWSIPAVAGSTVPEIVLRALDPAAETGLWLEPNGALELRQRVLPLNREIEAYGAYAPIGQSRFDVEAAGLAAGTEQEWRGLDDWFAPAQFIAMTPDERLSAPSFEEMDAGVSLSASGVKTPTQPDDLATVDLEYEELVLEDDTRSLGTRALAADRFAREPRFPVFGSNATSSRHAVGNMTTFSIAPQRYVVVDALDATPIGKRTGKTFADAIVARRRSASATRTRARVVPVQSTRESAT